MGLRELVVVRTCVEAVATWWTYSRLAPRASNIL